MTRRVYVPSTSPWARWLEYFVNPTAAPISAVVRIETNCGSDGGTTITSSFSGDLAFTTADRWLATDDFSDGGGDPSLNHNFWGPGAVLTPSLVSMLVFSCAGSEGPNLTFPITVPAGGTVILMHLAGQNLNRATSFANAMTIDSIPAEILFGMSGADQGAVVNWGLCNPGDDLDMDGFTCDGGDCNDQNAGVNPGAAELCNGVDDDCDGGSADGADEASLGTPCDGPDSDLCQLPRGRTGRSG